MLMLPDFRVRQRDFLLEISRAITAQLDLSEVLRRVLNASVVMLAGQIGLVALRDSAGDYQVRATLGVDSEHLAKINREFKSLVHDAANGIDAEALDNRLKNLFSDLDPNLRQYVALPLVFANEPLGLLVIFRTYHGKATADDIQVLQSFADQAAIAVHNAAIYERMDQERKRLAAIVQYSADGVMILDAHLNILIFNRAAERITGWRAADTIGLSQDEVIAWKHLDQPPLKDAIAAGWPKGGESETVYVEGDLRRKDGLTLGIAITYAPLLSSEGELQNIIANVRDVSNFRKAQEMQNVFISTVSHELKTPVAIIKGYAGTLNRKDAHWTPEVVHDSLVVIEEEADRLTGLIENLLTTSKIQAQRELTLNLGDVRLNELAARAVERFTPQAGNHSFKLKFPTGFPVVSGDETQLRQVLDNLIGNALKYSPNGGTIEVGGTLDVGQISVFVKDQGVGMTERDQQRIFERFYRVDDALSRKTQGTGLGLYLAKSIIEAHGGTMRVESEPGQGSTFTFTLPLHDNI